MNEMSQCPVEGAIGLLALLIRTGRLAEARLDEALAKAGLTFVKWRTLDTLVKASESVPLGSLSEGLHCGKSNVTQLVDKLEADGLMRRVPDPCDRRGTLAELTDSGREAHRAGRESLERATESFFADFSREEWERLRRLLSQLLSA